MTLDYLCQIACIQFTTDNQELNKLAIFQIEYFSCSYGYLQIVPTPSNSKCYSNSSYQMLWPIIWSFPKTITASQQDGAQLGVLLAHTAVSGLFLHSLLRSWHTSSNFSLLLAPDFFLHNSLH